MAKSTKTTRVSVPASEFVQAVVSAAQNGKTNESVAEATGMKVNSVATRISQLNAKLREAGQPTLPKLARRPGGGGGRALDLEALGALIPSE